MHLVSTATDNTAEASRRIDEILTMPNFDVNTDTAFTVCHSALTPPHVIPEDTIVNGSCSIDDIATVFQDQFPPGKEFPTIDTAKHEIKALAKTNDFRVTVCGFSIKCNDEFRSGCAVV